MTAQIKSKVEILIFDKCHRFLWDLSVKWLWNAYQAVNKPEIIKKMSTKSKKKMKTYQLDGVRPLHYCLCMLSIFPMKA